MGAAGEAGGLPPVEEVRPGLWSLAVPIPASPLAYVLCYAFELPGGGVVLVDPGWPRRAALGEAQAHLIVLEHRGSVSRSGDVPERWRTAATSG